MSQFPAVWTEKRVEDLVGDFREQAWQGSIIFPTPSKEEMSPYPASAAVDNYKW